MNDDKQHYQADEPFLEERPIILSPEAQRVFFEALMAPPKVKPALRKLMQGSAAGPKSTKPTKRKKK